MRWLRRLLLRSMCLTCVPWTPGDGLRECGISGSGATCLADWQAITEAARAILRFGFEELGLHRVWAGMRLAVLSHEWTGTPSDPGSV